MQGMEWRTVNTVSQMHCSALSDSNIRSLPDGTELSHWNDGQTNNMLQQSSKQLNQHAAIWP